MLTLRVLTQTRSCGHERRSAPPPPSKVPRGPDDQPVDRRGRGLGRAGRCRPLRRRIAARRLAPEAGRLDRRRSPPSSSSTAPSLLMGTVLLILLSIPFFGCFVGVFIGVLRDAEGGRGTLARAATLGWTLQLAVVAIGILSQTAVTWRGASGLDPHLVQFAYDLGTLVALRRERHGRRPRRRSHLGRHLPNRCPSPLAGGPRRGRGARSTWSSSPVWAAGPEPTRPATRPASVLSSGRCGWPRSPSRWPDTSAVPNPTPPVTSRTRRRKPPPDHPLGEVQVSPRRTGTYAGELGTIRGLQGHPGDEAHVALVVMVSCRTQR